MLASLSYLLYCTVQYVIVLFLDGDDETNDINERQSTNLLDKEIGCD